MTDNPFLPTQPNQLRKRKSRAAGLRTALVVGAVVAALGAFVLVRNAGGDPPRSLTAVFVEPASADPATLTSSVNAEIDDTAASGTSILVGGVLDGTDATTFVGTFTCPRSQNSITCERNREATRDEVGAAADGLLQAPRPAAVDLFAPFRSLADHFEATPSKGGVKVFLNVSGRHDVGPVVLGPDAARLSVDDAATRIREAGLFPTETTGWVVHLVMPTTGDPRSDEAIAAILRTLLADSGGRLATTGQRWLTSESQAMKLPSYEPGLSAAQTGRVTTFTMGQALFDTGSAELRPDAVDAVNAVGEQIRSMAGVRSIQVAGFADSTGSDEVNIPLSAQRAENVRNALASSLGWDPSAIAFAGYGSVPSAEGDRQSNRRVDIVVTARA